MIDLTQAIAYFDEAEELTVDARALSEKCRDYYDGKQLTEKKVASLNNKKQPPVVRNRIKPKVDYLKGVELQSRTDPEAVPRTQSDEESAQMATNAVRYVYEKNKFEAIKSDCFMNLTIEGMCGAEVYCKEDAKGKIQVCIRRYQWDRLGYDPHSRELNFSDTLYRNAIAWMDYDHAAERYPNKADVLSSTISREGIMSTTYDDAPRQRWADARRKRVRVVKLEYLYQGEVWVCEFTRGGFLCDPCPSPYLDQDDVPEWSIILHSAHCDRDGNRYGYVKAWLDVQDEINKRASKYLHMISTRQTFSTEGVGNDVQKLKSELDKPNGHLQFARGEFGKDFGVIPSMDQAGAQFNLLTEAKQEIDSVGVNGALAGVEARDLSGNAIRRLQQGASVELKPLFEAINQFDNSVCRAVWNRIRQFWTDERWIRITDETESPQWIGLNTPYTMRDQMIDEYGAVPPGIEDDPRLDMVIGTKNDITSIDVDFTIVTVPDVANSNQEQFEALTAIYPAIPDDKKAIAFEMLVESSNLPNKQQTLKRFREMGNDPDSLARAELIKRTEEANAQLIETKVLLAQAQAEKQKASAIVDNIEALYAAIQAAQVAASVPGIVPIADGMAKSGGFIDKNAAPIFPNPQPPAAAAMAQPQQPVLPEQQRNTSPMFPAQMQGPGEGLMHGIETQRADGVRG